MLHKGNQAGAVGMKYGGTVGGYTIQYLVMCYEGQRVRQDDAALCFENDGIGNPTGRPGILNMFALHIGDDGVIIGWCKGAIG